MSPRFHPEAARPACLVYHTPYTPLCSQWKCPAGVGAAHVQWHCCGGEILGGHALPRVLCTTPAKRSPALKVAHCLVTLLLCCYLSCYKQMCYVSAAKSGILPRDTFIQREKQNWLSNSFVNPRTSKGGKLNPHCHRCAWYIDLWPLWHVSY